jgi:hypothetical protein
VGLMIFLRANFGRTHVCDLEPAGTSEYKLEQRGREKTRIGHKPPTHNHVHGEGSKKSKTMPGWSQILFNFGHSEKDTSVEGAFGSS